ncbi:intracellular hyaluronan-binding protein 4 [Eleutherodactylus coqui]|uniref:intracellular hyaluronan-binding protein 4 n=1 Tax=Eleutherodactylus coqui TaxID=57060 RepID=UPI003462B36C
MKAEGSPVSTTMQEAFGCAVANRFFHLLDDESDPLDFLHQTSAEHGQKKKKDAAAKKTVNQKSNKKESQKERKSVAAANPTEAPSPNRTPKQPVQKVPQNENVAKVERSEFRTAFREFRPNFIEKPVEYREFRSNFSEKPMEYREFSPSFIEKPMEYSMDNFEKERQVRNWVANQRGGMRGGGMRGRGRGGFPRNMENDYQRGKREFERHSGSDKAGIKAEDKRGGGGPRNWGSIKDPFSEAEPTSFENAEAMEPGDTMEEQQGVQMAEQNLEDYTREMSLDEWKSLQDQSKPKSELNLRKLDSSVPSKAFVIHKSRFVNSSKENDEDYQYGFRKPVNDITSQLDINFGSLTRPGRGGRGGGRGRVRREEGFSHEVYNVNEFVLNPDDPEDFPALI